MDRKDTNLNFKGVAKAIEISIGREVKQELFSIAPISGIAKKGELFPDGQTTPVNRLNLRTGLHQAKLQRKERKDRFPRVNPAKNPGNPRCLLINKYFFCH
jgi:hypothetical protein